MSSDPRIDIQVIPGGTDRSLTYGQEGAIDGARAVEAAAMNGGVEAVLDLVAWARGFLVGASMAAREAEVEPGENETIRKLVPDTYEEPPDGRHVWEVGERPSRYGVRRW